MAILQLCPTGRPGHQHHDPIDIPLSHIIRALNKPVLALMTSINFVNHGFDSAEIRTLYLSHKKPALYRFSHPYSGSHPKGTRQFGEEIYCLQLIAPVQPTAITSHSALYIISNLLAPSSTPNPPKQRKTHNISSNIYILLSNTMQIITWCIISYANIN